jgi:hypothetical protein
MPAEAVGPRASSTVPGASRARPAQRQSRRTVARLSALSTVEFTGPPHRRAARPAPVPQPLVTVAFSTVTGVFGGPSPDPLASPAFAIACTALSPAASIFPKTVYVGGSFVSA